MAVAVAALLAGCTLPGRSYDHHLPPTPRSHAQYTIAAITPALLVRQANLRMPSQTASVNPSIEHALANYRYRVGVQDVLSVVVWDHPELTLPQGQYRSAKETGFIVRSDGTIFYPYVGSVHVAGETTEQIRRQLAKALEPYVKNPQVDVKVVGFHSKKYQLAGAIFKPRLYPITNVPLTIAQAITSAGSILRTQSNGNSKSSIPRSLADLSHVILIRNGKRVVLNLRAFYRHGDQSQNRLIQSGDIIEVPDNAAEQIHLIGEVHDPGNYPMDHGDINLAQALGDAGGISLTTADAGHIFVFRGGDRKPHVFWLDASSPDAMLLAAQFQLKPQDVVYVATADISAFNRIIQQILPTVQTAYETKVLVHP
jgi:polysaccharide export outer membrane protein